MAHLTDEEVQRRLKASTARAVARASRRPLPEEEPVPMPKPATEAAPPTPWQDREPGSDDA